MGVTAWIFDEWHYLQFYKGRYLFFLLFDCEPDTRPVGFAVLDKAADVELKVKSFHFHACSKLTPVWLDHPPCSRSSHLLWHEPQPVQICVYIQILLFVRVALIHRYTLSSEMRNVYMLQQQYIDDNGDRMLNAQTNSVEKDTVWSDLSL